ncbi:hypothetical protein [Bdellovibrio sp. HCB337]|uniref:hypothetical protein n=1 Tax=Bdellovibrio sp. HCB337 TaxID=3394358 RepID=UPI0039A6B8DA
MIKALLLLLTPVFAYIPPTRMILQRTAENAGSGIYTIEQEVQFNNVQDSLFLKETWVIENDRTMRVTVTGTKELKDQIKLQFIYAGGQRWSMNAARESRRISEDFLEKYFNFRSTDQLAANLMQLKILPANAFAKKPIPKNLDNLKYEPDDYVRLSRAGGVPNYAFGAPTANDSASSPGVWIEQDQFLIRKLRLPSQVEVTADNYNQYARGLNYPKTRTIRWGQNTVNIRLIGVSSRSGQAGNTFQPASLDVSTKLDGLNNQPARDAVIDFYSRFR